MTDPLSPGLNKLLVGFPTTAAWALCTFAYSAGPGHEPILFEGRTDGHIVPARGGGSFGWDPCFEAEDTGKTYVSQCHPLPCVLLTHLLRYAEMASEEKNKISHRGRAVEKLEKYLRTLPQAA